MWSQGALLSYDRHVVESGVGAGAPSVPIILITLLAPSHFNGQQSPAHAARPCYVQIVPPLGPSSYDVRPTGPKPRTWDV